MRSLCAFAISHIAMMLFFESCAVIGPVLCAMSLVPAMMCTTRGFNAMTSACMRTSSCGVVCALMPRPTLPFEKNSGVGARPALGDRIAEEHRVHLRAARDQLCVVVAITREPRPVREQQRRLQRRRGVGLLAALLVLRERRQRESGAQRCRRSMTRRFDQTGGFHAPAPAFLARVPCPSSPAPRRESPEISPAPRRTAPPCRPRRTRTAAPACTPRSSETPARSAHSCPSASRCPAPGRASAPRVGKISREIHPDHRALRKREERDEHDEHRQQQTFALARCARSPPPPASAQRRADGADQQQFLAADAVDDAQRDHGGDEIRRADGHRLQMRCDQPLKPAYAKMSLR